MKRLISLAIKIGIVGGIAFLLITSNPSATKHKNAIAAKEARLQDKDILGQTERMMRRVVAPRDQDADAPMNYHDYHVFSKVTAADGDMLSYGFCGKVFVTKSEL